MTTRYRLALGLAAACATLTAPRDGRADDLYLAAANEIVHYPLTSQGTLGARGGFALDPDVDAFTYECRRSILADSDHAVMYLIVRDTTVSPTTARRFRALAYDISANPPLLMRTSGLITNPEDLLIDERGTLLITHTRSAQTFHAYVSRFGSHETLVATSSSDHVIGMVRDRYEDEFTFYGQDHMYEGEFGAASLTQLSVTKPWDFPLTGFAHLTLPYGPYDFTVSDGQLFRYDIDNEAFTSSAIPGAGTAFGRGLYARPDQAGFYWLHDGDLFEFDLFGNFIARRNFNFSDHVRSVVVHPDPAKTTLFALNSRTDTLGGGDDGPGIRVYDRISGAFRQEVAPPDHRCGAARRTTFDANDRGTFPDRDFAQTLRFLDVTGDGIDDACAGHSTGTQCAVSSPTGAFGSATTWSSRDYDPARMIHPDLNGDGRQDLCELRTNGIYCGLSTGNTFGTLAPWLSRSFTGAEEFLHGDVDGDDDPDVCLRTAVGIYCARNDGGSFSDYRQWSSNYRDSFGWNAENKRSTIRLIDLDFDHKVDICGRGSNGMVCARSTGSAFGTATLWTTQFSDGAGWNHERHWKTVQFADVNFDGRADVCGRGAAGVLCRLNDTNQFAATDVVASGFGDADGWTVDNHFETVTLVDVNGDYRADVCGRGPQGIVCAYARPAGGLQVTFTSPQLRVRNFGDNFGWDSSEDFWGSLRAANVDDRTGAEFCGKGSSQLVCSVE